MNKRLSNDRSKMAKMLITVFRERRISATKIPNVSEELLEGIGEVSAEFRREMESILNQYRFSYDTDDPNA